jgi:regulator of sigma E protease
VTLNGVGFWAIGIPVTLLVLGVLVLVHELGHFFTARLAGIRVLEFGIGFPPKAKTLGHDHETEYTLNWLPIGGFCRMEGEDADSDDPRSFGNAPLVRQVAVLVAGVAMNVLTAFLLFFFVGWLFNPVVQPKVEQVVIGSPAEQAGIKTGDSLVSIDGQAYSLLDLGGDPFNGFMNYLHSRAGQPVTLVVADSSGHERTLVVPLRVPDAEHSYSLGVQFGFGISYVRGDPIEALQKAGQATVKSMTLILGALGDLGSHIASSPTTAPPGVSGPVGIAEAVTHTLFDYGPILLLLLAAIISANLALINILPIPPFDGGKVAIVLIKRAFGVKAVTTFEIATNLVGFALLMLFLAWISYFDILRLGSGG